MSQVNEKVYSIVSNMKSNYAGRNISAKLVGENIMLIMSSHENNVNEHATVEKHLKEVFNATIAKIKEEYESTYGHDLKLDLKSDVMDNQILGWGYETRGGGAFMGNAQQAVRSALFRVVRVYSVSESND